MVRSYNSPLIVNRFIVTILLLFLLLLNSCRKHNEREEGEILFNISYLDNKIQSLPSQSLPKELVVKFKNGYYLSELSGMFGYFKITNIINHRNSSNLTYLQVLNKKYYYQGEINELSPGFSKMPEMTIEYRNEVKNICGFECKPAIISFPSSDMKSFTVYYTDEITIKNPNSSNPYIDIDGVLLEFYLNLSKVEMKLTAKSISFKQISSKEFKNKPNFKRVPGEFITTVLDKIME
ncbi:MAG: hypothetical protein IMY71_09490 [Bacteroidetes bacterium]|nr:hypothetical protein [Bacteroidota bacterium]